MKLHRALRSDWSTIAPQERTIWQRLAACSHGVITPGNFISVVGAIIVLRGLLYLHDGKLIDGACAVIIGRLADVVDGMVADLTKTKSPLGEALDASIDKILLVLGLAVLLATHLLPLIIVLIMVIHALYNVGVSGVARRYGIRLHPSRAGKFCAVFEWCCVGLYLLVDILQQQQHTTTLVRGVALLSFGVFVILAVQSSINYTRKVYYKQAMGS